MGSRSIGKPATECPWTWDEVREILERGIMEPGDVGHCPFCGNFFQRSDGYPRKRQTKGGRRFGTRSCWQAWKMDPRLEGS